MNIRSDIGIVMSLRFKCEHGWPRLSINADSVEIIKQVLSDRFCAFNNTKIQQNTHSVLSSLDNPLNVFQATSLHFS